jgi:hypothetical protein
MSSSDDDEDARKIAAALKKKPVSKHLLSDDEDDMECPLAALKARETADRKKELDAAVALAMNCSQPTVYGTLPGLSQFSMTQFPGWTPGQVFPGFSPVPNSTTMPQLQPPSAKKVRTESGLVAVEAVTRTTNNKKKKKNPPDASAKKVGNDTKKREPLPAKLVPFRYEHRKRLLIEEEIDSKNKKDQNPYRVAVSVTTGKEENGDLKVWKLQDLRSEQLRELAVNFGCRNVGSASKYEVRKNMALRVDMGSMYDAVEAANITSTTEDMKTNTMLRIVNAAFLPENI